MAPGMFTSRILIYLDVAQFQIISCLLKLRPSCRWFIQLLPFAPNLSSTSGIKGTLSIKFQFEVMICGNDSYNFEARGRKDLQICPEPPSCPDFHHSFHSAGFWKFH
jgi:hypothetical protein